jgi:general secretion pathway protein D
MVQLVKALDTPAVSAAGLEVIPLRYADATAMAQVVTQLFQSSDSASQNGRGGRGGFGGFGGFPNPFGGGGGGNNNNSSTPAGRVTAPKVTAVADERSNSLVVTAPEDQLPGIVALVNQMDVDVDAVTELKVFRLKNADPQETADQLASLFPDPSTQGQRNRGFGFGPFGNFGGGGGGGNNQSTSTRKQSMTKVTAVADPRTQSVLVSASHDMMAQITGIVVELDSDPARKKKVHVIKVENRDPQELVQDLQSVIASDSSSGTLNNSRNSQNQSGSQLNTRQQNNLQNQGQNQGFSSGFGQGNNRTGGTGR